MIKRVINKKQQENLKLSNEFKKLIDLLIKKEIITKEDLEEI